MGSKDGCPSPSRVGYCLLFLLVFAAGPSAAQEAAPPGDPTGEVACPVCDADGKARCATCEGKGELFRACPTCQGSGQRPCGVCSEDRSAGAKGSGRAACDECGGRGALRNGRACSRCGGQQTLPCTACSQSGVLPCKKLLPDKICPECGFVGKVTCKVCGGDRKVSAQELAARRRRGPEPAPARAVSIDDVATASRQDLASGPQSFKLRVATLREQDAAFLDVFAQDPTQKLNLLRKQSTEALRRLAAWKDIDPGHAQEIGKIADRLTNARDRWKTLRSLFDETHRAIEKAQSVSETREQRLLETRGAARAALEEQLEEQMRIVLGIAEKYAARLSREEPDFLPREIAAVSAALEPLLAAAEKAVADAQQAEAERRAALAAARAAEKQRLAATSARPAASRAHPTSGSDPGMEAIDLPEGDLDSLRHAPERAQAEGGDRVASLAPASRPPPAAPGTSAGGMRSFALVVAGCLLAIAIGWLVSRARSASPGVDEDAPRAVS